MGLRMESYTIRIGRHHYPPNVLDHTGWEDLRNRVDAWCANYWKTCPTRYAARWKRMEYDVTFYDKRMAMAFKLAWG